MSLLLFNLYIADLDEKFRGGAIGGISVDKQRIWNLAYADDIVLLIKNREALQDMIGSFRIFRGKEIRAIYRKNYIQKKGFVCNRRGREKMEI